jgi:hypothetical protein
MPQPGLENRPRLLSKLTSGRCFTHGMLCGDQPLGQFSLMVRQPKPMGKPRCCRTILLTENCQQQGQARLIEGVNGRCCPPPKGRIVLMEFMEHRTGQTRFNKQADRLAASRPCGHRPQFSRNAFRADGLDQMGHGLNCSTGFMLQWEAEASGESNSPQHPQMIFPKSHGSDPNRPNQALLEIVLATNVVNNSALERVKEHSIDGEVSPEGILAGTTESDPGWMPTIGVRSIRTECCHFHLPSRPRPKHRHHTKSCTDS